MAELTQAQIESERVRFEAWALLMNQRIDRTEADKEHNNYQSAVTTFYWWGWLARASEVADQGDAAFGWLLEGEQGYRSFAKSTDCTKPVIDLHQRMAQQEPDKYKFTPLYTRPAAPADQRIAELEAESAALRADAERLAWLLTEVPSGRPDRPAVIKRDVDRYAGRSLLEFRVWGTRGEAVAAIDAARAGKDQKNADQI